MERRHRAMIERRGGIHKFLSFLASQLSLPRCMLNSAYNISLRSPPNQLTEHTPTTRPLAHNKNIYLFSIHSLLAHSRNVSSNPTLRLSSTSSILSNCIKQSACVFMFDVKSLPHPLVYQTCTNLKWTMKVTPNVKQTHKGAIVQCIAFSREEIQKREGWEVKVVDDNKKTEQKNNRKGQFGYRTECLTRYLGNGFSSVLYLRTCVLLFSEYLIVVKDFAILLIGHVCCVVVCFLVSC